MRQTPASMSVVRRVLSRPLPPRVAIVQGELDRFSSARYLEIGVHTGVLFLHVRAHSKHGVDPDPHVPRWKWLAHPNSVMRGRLVTRTSDEFFASLDADAQFDVVFVDGLHLYEQSLRDIENSLAHLSDTGVVLVHDCNPTSAEAAARVPDPRAQGPWCGDVWKAIAQLRATRSDLFVETIDDDFGVGVVRRGANPMATTPFDPEDLSYADLNANRAQLLGLRALDAKPPYGPRRSIRQPSGSRE
jgi:Methyltransferase domain